MKFPSSILVFATLAFAATAGFLLIRGDEQATRKVLETAPPVPVVQTQPLISDSEAMSIDAGPTDAAMGQEVSEMETNDASNLPVTQSEALRPDEEKMIRRRRVSMFLDRSLKSDQGIQALMAKVRAQPEIESFAGPVHKHLGEALAHAMPKKFQSGEIYWECGSELCFVEGISHESALNNVFDVFQEAMIENDLDIVVGHGTRRARGDWVYFVIGEHYAL